MTDLARRFANNPIISPADLSPSRPGLSVVCALNPAAFRFKGLTWLLLRVAEAMPVMEGRVNAAVIDPAAPERLRLVDIAEADLDLIRQDPRGFTWRGKSYLTTISHLRLAYSQDGASFQVETAPALEGLGELETFGIEDCRVTEIDNRFWLAYTAVSPDGIGVDLASTVDWRTYDRLGMAFPPSNKDCALFPERHQGAYIALHRPASEVLGGKSIWISRSPDLTHWGEHRCILRQREGAWDSARVGAGPPPLRIPEGWLEIYHGADGDDRYCLGAALLDADDPGRVLGRSRDPIMEPLAEYERQGFFGNVVFATGAFVDSDQLTLYYGAADEHVCGATMSIREILAGLD